MIASGRSRQQHGSSGMEYKEIPFVVVLDSDGSLVSIEDTREGEGRAKERSHFWYPGCKKHLV